MRAVVVVIVLGAGTAHAQPADEWEWGAVPVVNYNSDAGLGVGALGMVTLRDPDVKPHRAQVVLGAFVTTKLLQAHGVRWDLVGYGHHNLRLQGAVGYFSTVNRNYCGLGHEVTCATADAEAAADAAGLVGDERADFVRHYYHVRVIAPTASLGARWRLSEDSAASLFAKWRVVYYRSGALGDRGPYPGSLFATDHPDGEEGVASLPLFGIIYDTRDREATPTGGVSIEASARVTAGGTWTFGGVNASVRVYQRINERLVTATRVIGDVGVGDEPVAEMSLVNGTNTYGVFGGEFAGRGIRAHRYVGQVKAIAQEELRVDAIGRWQAVAFVDVAWIAVSLYDVGGSAAHLLGGGGVGARWVRSESFVLRGDIGVSPHEGWAPQVYLQVGHVY